MLVHFPREFIDENVVLDVFPAPRKMVRVALLVVHGVDPRLQDRARVFVQQLGDQAYSVREAAEAKLQALGPVAVPVLEDALVNKDVEIVLRRTAVASIEPRGALNPSRSISTGVNRRPKAITMSLGLADRWSARHPWDDRGGTTRFLSMGFSAIITPLRDSETPKLPESALALGSYGDSPSRDRRKALSATVASRCSTRPRRRRRRPWPRELTRAKTAGAVA